MAEFPSNNQIKYAYKRLEPDAIKCAAPHNWAVMSTGLPQENSFLSNIPIYLIGFIVVGLFMGGIYSLPAIRLTKSTDPWLTILLSIGLTTTVAAIGLMFSTSYLHIIYVILFANALLIIRRCFGKMDHNVERFGLIHGLSLIASFWYFILLNN